MENTENRVPKVEIKKLKEEIKVAAAYQRFLKNQRKSEKIVGPREMSHSEATMKHRHNRLKLSAMYVAYGVIRGKDFEKEMLAHVTKKEENLYDADHVKSMAEKFISEYRIEEVEVVNEN